MAKSPSILIYLRFENPLKQKIWSTQIPNPEGTKKQIQIMLNLIGYLCVSTNIFASFRVPFRVEFVAESK